MTQTNELIELFIHGNQLKRTPRTGWLQRGVSQPETVAAHTCGVAFIALVLSELVEAPIDRGRLLAMAILHDLPEGLTSDIPAPAWRRLPAGAKYGVERQAMLDILGQTGVRAPLMAYWEGLDDGNCAIVCQVLVDEVSRGTQIVCVSHVGAGGLPLNHGLRLERGRAQ